MADVHEPQVRSYNMSRIKGKNTKPEMVVRKYLHSQGYRYNLHGKYKGKTLPGKPDLVLPKYNTVIFVHGCFWHAHEGCKYFKIPETNREWWEKKLLGNRERDRKNVELLRANSWQVLIIFECEVKFRTLDGIFMILEQNLKDYGNGN
jgi:DNA mismatch endonuclease (patch repair protein)